MSGRGALRLGVPVSRSNPCHRIPGARTVTAMGDSHACPMCSQTFHGPAYMVDGARKHGRSWTRTTLLICPPCYAKPPLEHEASRIRWHWLHAATGEPLPPAPCLNCGRVIIRGANNRLQRITCSKVCSTALTRVSTGNAGSSQPCAGCGTAITTGRSDSKFCGSPCRQRAYRQRQATDRHA